MTTSKRFPSKISWWLIIPIFGLLISLWIFSFFEKPFWLGSVILLPVIAFVADIFLRTDYTVEADNTLLIRCGVFYRKRIDIKSIKRISESNNPISSPAASLDRLDIQYGQYSSILISPQHKHEFIEELKSIQPEIEIFWRKGNK
jgi:hypothetical protein